MAREPILNNLPRSLGLPIVAVLFYLSILVYVVALPLAALYGLLLRPVVWIEWERRDKDVLVVDFDSAHSKEWMARILPVVGTRAVFLNYSNRDHWDRRSLEAQIFAIYGPHPIPERFMPGSLPAVIFFKRLRRPKVFNFGNHFKHHEDELERLRSELTATNRGTGPKIAEAQ
jgi:hypothetical protein